MKPISDQSKELRKRLFCRFVFAFIIYTLGMFALYAVFETYISPAIGNIIADNTSEWVETSMEEFDQAGKDHRMIQADTSSLHANPDERDTIRYRTLDTYAFLKVLKDNALPVIFVLGIAGLIAFFLNKFVHYFDELSASVTALFANKTAPIMLNPDLAIVQNELNGIRSEFIQNERRAKEAETRKNKLVTYIAHDARTPLTSITGYLALLKEPELPSNEKRISYATIAYEQARNLNVLLDELFEITRFNIQGIHLAKRPTDIRTLYLQVCDEFHPALEEKSLQTKIDTPLNLYGSLDSEKMARALANIMRNAIHYAENGSAIELVGTKRPAAKSANREGSTNEPNGKESSTSKEESNVLTLSISNHGQPIAPENLEKIFERFYRENEARTANRGSAGLGLAITKEIIEAHGGSIHATSENFLTTFIIEVPQD
ncbi:MAG: HAMP domain-containing sensor histidine kinase [Eggerthellaceae bacterium]